MSKHCVMIKPYRNWLVCPANAGHQRRWGRPPTFAWKHWQYTGGLARFRGLVFTQTGENSLMLKVRQLKWLTMLNSGNDVSRNMKTITILQSDDDHVWRDGFRHHAPHLESVSSKTNALIDSYLPKHIYATSHICALKKLIRLKSKCKYIICNMMAYGFHNP